MVVGTKMIMMLIVSLIFVMILLQKSNTQEIFHIARAVQQVEEQVEQVEEQVDEQYPAGGWGLLQNVLHSFKGKQRRSKDLAKRMHNDEVLKRDLAQEDTVHGVFYVVSQWVYNLPGTLYHTATWEHFQQLCVLLMEIALTYSAVKLMYDADNAVQDADVAINHADEAGVSFMTFLGFMSDPDTTEEEGQTAMEVVVDWINIPSWELWESGQ
jgi:hypothetical protein